MHRLTAHLLYGALSFSVVACGACGDSENLDNRQISQHSVDEKYMGTTQDSFDLSPEEIDRKSKIALKNDDAALVDLVRYYQFNDDSKIGRRKLLFWLKVGADRNIKGISVEYLREMSRRGLKDCKLFEKYMENISESNPESLSDFSELICH